MLDEKIDYLIILRHQPQNWLSEKLMSWTERKKDIRYYLIEHNEDENNRHFHIVLDFGDTAQARFSTLKKLFPYGDIDRLSV